jgi:zinc protease
MMFSGSEHIPQPDQVLAAIGAQANGSTNFDRTNYYETVPATQLPTALWLESDRMGFLLPTLDQKKLETQRDVVSNELRQRIENQPYGRAFLTLCDTLYPKPHPYFHCVIGAIEEIQAASLEDVRGFFREYYRPSNATLALVGDFDPKVAKELVSRYFGPLPSGPVPQARRTQPRPSGVVERTIPDPVARISPAPDGVERGEALRPGGGSRRRAVGGAGGTKTSRLYRRLVLEKQLATGVYASNASLGLGGYFQVVATVRDGHTVAELRKEVESVLETLRRDGPTDEEVERAKRNVVGSLVRSVERVAGKADQLNGYAMWTDDPGYLPKDVARYRAVTKAQVHEAARTLLPADRVLVLDTEPSWHRPGAGAMSARPAGRARRACSRLRGPQPTPPLAAAPPPPPADAWRDGQPAPLPSAPPFSAPVAVAHTLPNRLGVLLRENHAVPVVVVELAIKTGVDGDPPGRAGLADFLGGVLDEGTKTRTSDQLAAQLEDLAAFLSVSTGLDGVRIHLNCLSDTLQPALELLADVALNPAFRTGDVERVRGQILTGLQQRRGNPAALASDEVARILYGPKHPWGQPAGGTPESVRAIRREDLVRFHDTYFGRATRSLVSATSSPSASSPGGAAVPGAPAPFLLAPPRSRRPAPGGDSGLLGRDPEPARPCHPHLARHPSRRPGALHRQRRLGGIFTSRLNHQLREVRGWTTG